MIDPKELRIGNIITDEENNIYEVVGLQERSITIRPYGQYEEYPIEYMQVPAYGILLTNDLILKCGFKNDFTPDYNEFDYYNKKGYSMNGFKLVKLYDENTYRFKYENIDIHYIHQFQNLYFALTGKEMEVNL